MHDKSQPNGFASSPHAHSFLELGMVFEGTCTWRFPNRRAVTAKAGEMVLIPPLCEHREEAQGRVRLGWVGYAPHNSSPKNGSVRHARGDNGDAQYLLEHLYREQKRSGSAEICAVTLHHILLLFHRAEKEKKPLLKRDAHSLNERQIQIVQSAATYLDRNAGQRLSMEQVADYHRLSAHHLNTLFQNYYKMTPTRYRMRQRITAAQTLLEEGRLSIKEIATAGGFTDAAHFSREYKRRTGRTPGETRDRRKAL